MSHALLLPSLSSPDAVVPILLRQGYAVIDGAGVARLSGCDAQALNALRPTWNDLPADGYLKDGGHYRRRRHSCFEVDASKVTLVPHRAHWQPLEYNALHGGMQRWFEPLATSVLNNPVWPLLLQAIAATCTLVHRQREPGLGDAAAVPWFVEAHQFRIDTTDGIGRPTPEGAHRDGVDFVAVFLVERQGIKGGETRVFDADGPSGQRFTLTEPWSLLLLDDRRVIHESTPIQPTGNDVGYRDTLVLTYRTGGFQGQKVV